LNEKPKANSYVTDYQKNLVKDSIKSQLKKKQVDSTHDNKVLVQSLEMQENLKRMQEIKEYSLKNKISK